MSETKPVEKKYPLLTDSQCRKFLKDMREFGYPKLTFEEVRLAADEIHAGKKTMRGDVISVIMLLQIEEAMESQ